MSGLYLQINLLYSFISHVFLLNNLILFYIPISVFDFLLRELSSFTFTIIILVFMYLVARCGNSSWISLGKMEIQWLLQPEKARVLLEVHRARDWMLLRSFCSASLLCFSLTAFVPTHHSTHFPSFIFNAKKPFSAGPVAQTLRSIMFTVCARCLCVYVLNQFPEPGGE